MLRSLLIAASAAAVLSACPNSCNGHGYCDSNERCVCFTAPGHANLKLWTGADCSQRVCPYGATHDLITDATQKLSAVWSQTDSQVGFIPAAVGSTHKLRAFLNGGYLGDADVTVEVRIVRVDVANKVIRYQWKTSSQKTFGSEVEASADSTARVYTSRASAYHVRPDDADTGIFIYFDIGVSSELSGVVAGDRYYLTVSANNGLRFVSADGNTAHQLAECSGRGACDRSSGQCKCTTGYTGDSCHRTVCPNDCSGHGICQSQSYFVGDAGLAYGLQYTLGFDAQTAYGCKCDNGYRGADCSQRECPSGPDPLGGDGGAQGLDCSGRGMCDYTTGICKCHKGYYGERCEVLTNLV